MKIRWTANSLQIDFDAVEMLEIMEAQKSLGIIPPASTCSPPALLRAVVTDQRAAQMEMERDLAKRLRRNEFEAREKLQAGVLPFKVQEKPPGIPLKDSPRTMAQKTGQFAGESQTKRPGEPKPSSPTSDSASTTTASTTKHPPTKPTSAT